MFYHVYASSASRPFTQADFVELLTRARDHNARVGITGVLLHRDGNFMQYLEGPEPELRSLLLKIRLDSRHRGVSPLLEGSQQERQFPDWPMDFRDLRSPDSSFDDSTPDPTGVKRLLRAFASSGR